MMGFLIAIHVMACVLLITIVLIQSGRGGGLVEGFSGVESMFGTKTNAFLTRSTTVFAIVFFLTCLSLAILSSRQSKSLMQRIVIPQQELPAPIKTEAAPKAQVPPLEQSKEQPQNTQQ